MRARLAWSLFALTVVTSVVHVALLVALPEPILSTAVIGEGFPLVTIGAIAGAGVGALIVSRYPGHPVGWLFVVGQLFSEVGLAVGVYGHGVLSGQLGNAPGGHLGVWLSIHLGGLFVVAILAIVFLLAPDGHLVSPRWRWAVALVLSGLVANHVAVATVSPERLDQDGRLIGAAPSLLTTLLVGASVAVGIGVLAGAVAVVVRLRRSSGDRRQQLRWVALAAGALAAGVVVNAALAALGAPDWIQSLPVMAAYACLPVFIGIAILRHRLFDIDVFINRALVLTMLTAVVSAGYVGLVVLLSDVAPVEHETFWPPFLATVVIALAFQPVRDAAQRFADRLVYGSRAAPYLQLAEFSKRLQSAAGTQELLRQMGEAVAGAVGARSASIHVGGEVTAADDAAGVTGQLVTVPVLEGGERLATLVVTMPPDRPLRPEEHRLLDDFAVQLGTALRNVRLQSTLADRVSEVRASAEALEASSHRLRLAQETERQRLEESLSRTVVPHLRDVETGVRSLLGEGAPTSPDPLAEERLERLAESTYAALESLRTLTRGVFPAQLARQGLVAALTSLLERTRAGTLTTELSTERFDPRIESCAYFCVVEQLRLVGTGVDVRLRTDEDGWLVVVVDGGAAAGRPVAGNLEDRVAALGGRLRPGDRDGRAVLTLELPPSVADAELAPDLTQ